MQGSMVPNLSETAFAEAFVRRLPKADDGTLPHVLRTIVPHLHGLIRELRPTSADWRKMIEFLTEVGHTSDERRQEWGLLFDLLGASALVDEINSRRPKQATPNTVRGPFFRADTPKCTGGSDISLDGVGERLAVFGQLLDLDGDPVEGAEVMTWQANSAGFYENQQPDLQPEFNLRGVFKTDRGGRFHYLTVRPAGYRVPDDGPVGKLLGQAGCPLRRPAHLHFIVTAPGFQTITTHIYDGSDPHIDEDAIFGVKPELVHAFERTDIDGKPGWRLDFKFLMARAREGAVS
ncbi:dioxygenase family protein [Ensifer sp. MJa1]|uniref:dioxygenase family protein n=1 Tax=Ensifer sp. MJa1 TaxID=2919888 RepID=UPI00300B4866